MRTPVEVTDELYARVKEHFSDEQLVEITALLTAVNLDRFNAAFGIGSAGFSEGLVACGRIVLRASRRRLRGSCDRARRRIDEHALEFAPITAGLPVSV